MNDRARVSLSSGEYFFAEHDENLLAAAQRAHWLIRYGCRNGNCEACTATLLSGRVLQREKIIDAASGSQSILLCLAQARDDVQIQLPVNPQHGNVEHARRGYAQFIGMTALADGCWSLEFDLPAGRQLPLYAGQYLIIESAPASLAYIGVDALVGRRLTVISESAPAIEDGERLFLRYPLGFAYRLAAAQPLWLLYENVTAKRALRLQTTFAAAHCLNMSAAISAWPQSGASIVIHAFADSENKVREWYAQLLKAGIKFAELRSDFIILQPGQ